MTWRGRRPHGYRRSRDLPRPLYVVTGYCDWQSLAKTFVDDALRCGCAACGTVQTISVDVARNREQYAVAVYELMYRTCPAKRRRVWPCELRPVPDALRPTLPSPQMPRGYRYGY